MSVIDCGTPNVYDETHGDDCGRPNVYDETHGDDTKQMTA